MEASIASPAPKARARGQAKQQTNSIRSQPQASTPQRAPRRAHQQQTPSHNQPLAETHHARQPRAANTNRTTSSVNTGYDNASPRPAPPQIATPVKQMAYAGPTFHASPAPSSLPIPRFFSKSVPNGAPTSALQARLDASPSRTPTSPTPHSGTVTPVCREESPLDLLFSAHRAEQAKQNLASPRSSTLAPGPYEASRPARASGKEFFMMEMDGAGDGTTTRRTVSTPFQERLEAVKQTPKFNNPPQPGMSDEQQRIQKSMALKNLLNVQPPPRQPITNDLPFNLGNNGNEFAQGPGPGPPRVGSYGQYPQAMAYSQYDHGQYQHRPPHMTMQDPAQGRGQPDVRTMEADLRKLLKLS